MRNIFLLLLLTGCAALPEKDREKLDMKPVVEQLKKLTTTVAAKTAEGDINPFSPHRVGKELFEKIANHEQAIDGKNQSEPCSVEAKAKKQREVSSEKLNKKDTQTKK